MVGAIVNPDSMRYHLFLAIYLAIYFDCYPIACSEVRRRLFDSKT